MGAGPAAQVSLGFSSPCPPWLQPPGEGLSRALTVTTVGSGPSGAGAGAPWSAAPCPQAAQLLACH